MPKSTSRGAAYPSINLRDAVMRLRRIYEQVGKGPSSKEAYIKGLGYSGISGASNRTFAALAHFNLIEKSGQDYKISDLGMQILYPRPDGGEGEVQLLRRSALAPRLFRSIYDRYVGEKLPVLLSNTLIHDFQVYDKSAKEAADNFKQSVEYAELLDNEGRLHDGDADAKSTHGDLENGESSPKEPAETSTMLDASTQKFELPLENGGKATLSASARMTDADKDRLKKAIDLFL